MLHFCLFGTFLVEDETGVDRRPKLMKARAILAVLASTPKHQRSRSWLQALLWPDRQPSQAMSSLRTALADIRRHLGPMADILQANHSEIRLDPSKIATDLETGIAEGRLFLEGFDVPHAHQFEDWMREQRQMFEATPVQVVPTRSTGVEDATGAERIYLGSICPPGQSLTQMQADALVDNLAKSTEDLGLAETLDGRGLAQTQEEFLQGALKTGCDLLLLSESVESARGSMIRLKVVAPETRRLVWSKTLTSDRVIALDDPATIVAVAEFVDVLAEQKARLFSWQVEDLPPAVIGMAGVRHMFRLGPQNYETAEKLLRLAYQRDRQAIYLAWRAYLRTFFIGEIEFGCRQTVIEEGEALSRRALEKAPHNSMVLAACAHVENMLHDSHDSAYDLAARALELNRCNPLAWSTMGVALAFLGDTARGKAAAKTGAKLSGQAWHCAQLEVLASSASLVAGDVSGALAHAERSHAKSPSYAPPLRFLSAIYHHTNRPNEAQAVVTKLRTQEPDFKLSQLREVGYPSESLRKAKLLESLPQTEL